MAGCDLGGRNDLVAPPPDSWLHVPSLEFLTSSQKLDGGEFAVVMEAKEAEALARLRDAAWVELSPREAEELAGRPLGGAGGRVVLLRGLSSDTPNGGFTVRWRPREVWIRHGCLSRRPLPVIRRGVVARLPDLPTKVYVDLCMAE
jgi:hypothetical protein